MNQLFSEIEIQTNGEGFIDISYKINTWIQANAINAGILVVFLKHTSCSLIINENADPKVLQDLSSYMKAIVPEEGSKPLSGEGKLRPYMHSQEGPDDMPAHIRTALTCNSLSLSINSGKIILGTWQAIYLWEHRSANYRRKVALHFIGEIKKKNEISNVDL